MNNKTGLINLKKRRNAMKRKYFKSLMVIGLIALTCVAMAYSGSKTVRNPVISNRKGIVALAGNLSQEKVLLGKEGRVSLSLTMTAGDVIDFAGGDESPVDLVIVLDRSGSMKGRKIDDAKDAVHRLLSTLSARDRIALVSYSNRVTRHSNLMKVTRANRVYLRSMIDTISAAGGTNLGGGLKESIDLFLGSKTDGRMGKVILISDGLANHGVTNPETLGRMASVAVKEEFGISTLGVGRDFNEVLMTAIADRGAGRYYYLEDPGAFAAVFQKEFQRTRAVAASAVEIRIPLKNGMSLIDAAGYPFEIRNGNAYLNPGNILSGEKRKLFFTFRMPTDQEREFSIEGITVSYRYKGSNYTAALNEPFRIACVKDRKEVFASIDKNEWEEKVIRDSYNSLRQGVAALITHGKKEEALERIKQYADEQSAINSVVGSARVSENLDKDVKELKKAVQDTFHGAPSEVAQKQKERAKVLQYKGYVGRREGSVSK